jgi:1-acyl-sn-glycerol-3-phosphate acyltransferase
MTTISISTRKLDFQAYLLCLVRALWIALPLAILLPLHLVWHLLKLPSPWAMLFLRISTRALGARVTVYGQPLRKDVFFVANHISWHDIPILAGITGTSFVAQDGVRAWPIIGWLAKLNRTIFISRTEKQNVAQQVAELRQAIAENWSVTLFPEGTTSDGLGLLPFKQSLFATLAPPPKPMMIQPVLLDFGNDGRLGSAKKRVGKVRGARLRGLAAITLASISSSHSTPARLRTVNLCALLRGHGWQRHYLQSLVTTCTKAASRT